MSFWISNQVPGGLLQGMGTWGIKLSFRWLVVVQTPGPVVPASCCSSSQLDPWRSLFMETRRIIGRSGERTVALLSQGSTKKYIFLTQIYFWIQETFKQTFQTGISSTNSPFEFVFSRWEFTKVIVLKKLVCNVRIKALRYTKYLALNFVLFECFCLL